MVSINKVDTLGRWMVGSNHLYIPQPGTKIEHSNVTGSSTGVTESGVMSIEWVRRDVVKVNLSWKFMSQSELTNVLSWMQGKEFVFKYYDCGVIKSVNAYCGKCDYTLYATNYQNSGEEVYSDVSINVIQK